MKTEITDVSDTQKTIRIEIPTEIVDAEINRIARDYTKQARIPGFRPGKVPQTLVKKRFRDQIRHDVMHGLIPRAVDDALLERGLEPVDTPDITDVALEEGQPLTFTAAIETVPAFDPGDLSTITLRESATEVADAAVDQMLQRLRDQAAKYEPIDGRPVAEGDTVVLDIERTAAGEEADRHENVTVELGSPANPPDFDANLLGLNAGETKTFTIRFPESYPVPEMAGTTLRRSSFTTTV